MPNDGYVVSTYADIHTEYAEQESKNGCNAVSKEGETIHKIVIREVKNYAESDEQSDELYNLFILIDELHQIIFCEIGFHGDVSVSSPHNNSCADATRQTCEYGNVRLEKERKKRKRSYLLLTITPAPMKASSPINAAIPIGVRFGTGSGGGGVTYRYCVTLSDSPGLNVIAFVSSSPQ